MLQIDHPGIREFKWHPMLPFGKSVLTSEEGYEDLRSRILWQVESRRSLLFPRSNSWNSNTSKPLVGQINDHIVVTRVRPFYISFFPQIFAKVTIDNTLAERRISLLFHMGLWTSLFYLQIIASALFILNNFLFSSQDINSVIDNVIFLLMYPGIATILAAIEAHKLKETITDLLEK